LIAPTHAEDIDMKTMLRSCLCLFMLLTVITGIGYPVAVTGLAKLAYPKQAVGSLIYKNDQVIGSELIGQNFTDPKYFWGRPSATAPQPNNGVASGGSNQGPLNPALVDAVKGRVEALHAVDPDNKQTIPADLVMSSASGLDPEISPAAAKYQAARIAKLRKINEDQVMALIAQHTHARQLGIFGEPRVNVLMLNLALDAKEHS
jgi:K+-transporting ATPase ATPase C chain